jgi:diacylglycerol kinase family enzyme
LQSDGNLECAEAVVVLYSPPMFRRKQQRPRNAHFCILTNPRSAQFSTRAVDRVISQIRKSGGSFSVCDGDSLEQTISRAKSLVGIGRDGRSPHPQITRFGAITALVACGGDGLVGGVAKIARQAKLPIGIVPLGRYNTIASALYHETSIDGAIKRILAKTYRTIDVGTIDDNLVIGSLGFGVVPELARQLSDRKSPRFGFTWSQLASKAIVASPMHTRIITVDSFRFEIPSTLLSIHFLSHSLGLNFSPASIADDGKIEVLFDMSVKPSALADFTKGIFKKKYLYTSDIRLFRGAHVSIAGVKGETVLIDGEFATLKSDYSEVTLEPRSLQIFA